MWRALTLFGTQYCLDTHWVLLSTETEMNDSFVISELLSDVEEEEPGRVSRVEEC